MILLIDAGNTRVKWGVVAGGEWVEEGVLAHGELAGLDAIAAAHPGLTRVFGANVAGEAVAGRIAEALRAKAPTPEWLRPSAECCGVRNLYATPSRLGADRWAALVGARALHRGACLVVCAGTATTVDVLDSEGRFQGGLILPGETLMRRALARDTADLPLAEGSFVLTPRRTEDAIVSGCLNAQAGAVERMFRLIAADPEAVCLLTGGAADRIRPLLEIPVRSVGNLVLKGLAAIAGETPSP